MFYFLDLEFNGHGSHEIISCALVREDGTPLSFVFGCPNPIAWVVQNVMPHLRSGVVTHGMQQDFPQDQAAKEIADFLYGDPNPIIVADWPADISYFCDLLQPTPGQMVGLMFGLTFRLVRVGTYPTTVVGAIQHNAYWDAMALRRACGKG